MPEPKLKPTAVIAYVVAIGFACALAWALITIYKGIPIEVQNQLIQNYVVVAVFPVWAILSFVLVLTFKETTKAQFDVEAWGLKFKGAGGLAMVWALMTFLGWIIIGHYWKP